MRAKTIAFSKWDLLHLINEIGGCFAAQNWVQHFKSHDARDVYNACSNPDWFDFLFYEMLSSTDTTVSRAEDAAGGYPVHPDLFAPAKEKEAHRLAVAEFERRTCDEIRKILPWERFAERIGL